MSTRTTHSGFLIQSTFGTKGNFELVVPRSRGFAHAYRDNDTPAQRWGWNGPFRDEVPSGRYPPAHPGQILGSMSLIQSSISSDLEAFALIYFLPPLQVVPGKQPQSNQPPGRYEVCRFYRSAGGTWEYESGFSGGITSATTPTAPPGGAGSVFAVHSAPAVIQGRFGTPGNYELVIPRATKGVSHYYRENVGTAGSWHLGAHILEDQGRVDAVALVLSNLGSPHNLELVALVGEQLVHLWRDFGPSFAWSGPSDPICSGVCGIPAFIQSTHGKRGNFELVAALTGGGLVHLYRDNDDSKLPWRKTVEFAAGMKFRTVGLIQSNFGTAGNLELVAQQGDGKLFHFYRDASMTWSDPIPLPAAP